MPSKAEVHELLSKPTISVKELVESGIYPIGRNAIYRACQSGDIETIRVGHLFRICTAPLKRKLGLDMTESATASISVQSSEGETEARASKRGRPPYSRAGERLSKILTFRMRPALHAALITASERSGRSMSKEIERRLEHSFKAECAVDEFQKDVDNKIRMNLLLTDEQLQEYHRLGMPTLQNGDAQSQSAVGQWLAARLEIVPHLREDTTA